MATATRNARNGNGKASAATVKTAKVSAKAPARKAKAFDGAELTFTLERETKNTFRYAEDFDGDARMPVTLYLPKEIIGETAPESITVTVS